MSDKTLFDAVNAALDSDGTDTGAPDEEGQVVAGADAEADSAVLEDGDDQGSDDAAGEAGEGDEQAGEGADGDGSEGEGDEGAATRDPATGKFVKKDGKQQQGDKPGEQKDGQRKEPDPINDPIPKDVKVETQQRIRTLIDRTKQAEERATTAQSNFDTIINGIKNTGTTPEQYSEVLSFMQLFNSGDPKQQGDALNLLESMADRLATHLGVERKLNDPLAGHQDLIAEVQAKTLTPARAREIARARNQSKFQGDLRTAATTDQQQREAAARELNTARVSLNELEETLSKTDPQWEAKKEHLMAILKPAFASIPPREWKAKFQEAYRNLKWRTPGAQQRRVVPQNQPMRAGRGTGNGGGKGGQEMAGGGPKTMLDAVSAALNSMPR